MRCLHFVTISDIQIACTVFTDIEHTDGWRLARLGISELVADSQGSFDEFTSWVGRGRAR